MGRRPWPLHWLLVVGLALLALFLLVARADADGGPAPAFYYGWGDVGYLGEHHAAYWHGETPWGWRDVVDLVYPGIATADARIPFGTRLCIEVVAVPAWAAGEYDHLVGRRAAGVVVDRMASWVYAEMGPAVDCWPALARRLMGTD